MIHGKTCKSCALWVHQPHITAERDIGQCRAKAPTLIQGNDGRCHSSWPLTASDAWCGAHATQELPESCTGDRT